MTLLPGALWKLVSGHSRSGLREAVTPDTVESSLFRHDLVVTTAVALAGGAHCVLPAASLAD